MNYMVALGFPFFVTCSTWALRHMGPEPHNHPMIFWGKVGSCVFLLCCILVPTGLISGGIWIFRNFEVLPGIGLLIAGFVLGALMQNFRRVVPEAIILILSSVGIVAMHWIAWW